MILGIGTDILKIQHIREILENENEAFIKRIYSKREKDQAQNRKDPIFYYATRFAGKEAVFKSLGIRANKIIMTEIEIIETETGRPEVILSGTAKRLSLENGINKVLITISYDADYAVAFAIASTC